MPRGDASNAHSCQILCCICTVHSSLKQGLWAFSQVFLQFWCYLMWCDTDSIGQCHGRSTCRARKKLFRSLQDLPSILFDKSLPQRHWHADANVMLQVVLWRALWHLATNRLTFGQISGPRTLCAILSESRILQKEASNSTRACIKEGTYHGCKFRSRFLGMGAQDDGNDHPATLPRE